ncbi:MAG: hypothetical protein V4594_15405 [Bacteroidota bacterium]
MPNELLACSSSHTMLSSLREKTYGLGCNKHHQSRGKATEFK